MQASKRFLKYLGIFVAVIVLYVVTAVPLGLFVYSWKSQKDINVFTTGGFHSYLSCVASEVRKAKINSKMIENSKFEKHDRAAE